MKNDLPPKWEERIVLPGRPPIRQTVNMEVMALAKKLMNGFEAGQTTVDDIYDDLMKAEHLFNAAISGEGKGK